VNRHLQTTLLSTAIGIVLSTGSAAYAQPAPDPEPQARKLDAMQVTASRRSKLVTDVAQGVTIVGADELKFSVTPMDALRGQTGTYFQSTTPGQSVVVVRGLKGSEVLHLVDGFRLNTTFFRNAPNQYVALVDGQSLDRIEVVRGPSSTLYGSDAMGGVVQMLTEAPRYSSAQWESEGRVRGFYNTVDDSLVTRVSASGGREGLALTAGLTYQDVNELESGGGETQPFTNYTSRAGDAKVVWAPADGHELTFSIQYLSQPRTPRFDQLVLGFGQTEASADIFFFEPQERRFGQVIYRGNVATAAWDDMELHLGNQRITDERRSRDRDSTDLDSEQNESDLFGFTAQFGKGVGDHYLTYGMDYYADEVSAARQRLDISSGVQIDRAPRFPDGSTQNTFGIYIVDDYRPDERLDLTFGLRYSDVSVELPTADERPGVSVGDSALTANIGLRYGLTESVNLVTSYARGFRTPNVFDLGTFGSRPGNRFNLPNADLTAETVDTFDLGIKWSSDSFEGELIGFYSDYQDKISSVLFGGVNELGQTLVQSQNVAELTLWGIEAGSRWYPSDATTVYASATYTRGEEKQDGEQSPADRIPPLFGRLGTIHRLNENWEFEGYSLFAARQDRLSDRDVRDARIDPNGTGGWATLNLRTSYRANQNLSFAVSLLNLTDKRYREHSSGVDAPGRGALFSVDWRIR